MRKLALLMLVSGALLWSSTGRFGPSDDTKSAFMGLGDLPGGNSNSAALGVSGDGSVVVGYSTTDIGFEAFRWTSSAGMAALGSLPGTADGMASAVSADGSVIAGWSHSRFGSEAFRWTQCSGVVSLEKMHTGEYRRQDFGEEVGISANGSVIVGTAETASGEEAFRWTKDTGMVGLGVLPGDRASSLATGASADGSVVVGSAYVEPGTGNEEAFRWTQARGMVGLGVLPGDVRSRANAVSADGLVVVGQSGAGLGHGEAFRWTQEKGMVGLGVLPGGRRNSIANGVSADGSVVVGASHGESGLEAFVWDSTHGMRSVRDVLIKNLGLAKSLKGWKLKSANAVSADGSMVVGCGINPDGNMEGWIASIQGTPIPKPTTLVSASYGLPILMLTMQRQRSGSIVPDTRQCENKH